MAGGRFTNGRGRSGRHTLDRGFRFGRLLTVILIAAGFLIPLGVGRQAAIAATIGVQSSRVIGYSADHHPITAYELGDPHAPYKALVLGSMHGFYERAGETVTKILRSKSIPPGIDLWVIDTLNPDGDVRRTHTNGDGVDLNRNWPHLWIPVGSSGCTPLDCHNSGPAALSEPETRAMYDFLQWLRPNRMVSLHQPLDGVDTTDGGARDIAFRNALVKNLDLPAKPLTCFESCRGTMTGWLTATQPGAAITVEFGWTPSAGYLSGQATSGILAALMVGRTAPVLTMTTAPVTSGPGARVTFAGRLTQGTVGLASAPVGLYSIAYGTLTWIRVGRGTADSGGNWRITVNAPVSGQLTYQARYSSGSTTIASAKTGFAPTLVTLRAPTTAVPGTKMTVSGRLTRGGGLAMTKLSVWAIRYGTLTWAQVVVATTDSNGNWTATVVAPSIRTTYQTRYSNSIVSSVSTPVSVSPTPTPALTVTDGPTSAPPGSAITYRGRLVRGANGMTGASVTWWAIRYGTATWMQVGRATTDASGSWRITLAAPATGRTTYQARYTDGTVKVVSDKRGFAPSSG